MRLQNFWKHQNQAEELTSQTAPSECLSESLKKIHGYCFFAIGQTDPDFVAEKIRMSCEEFHKENLDYQFHLIDEKRKKIIYYGQGKKRDVNLKSEIDLRMANALRILNEGSKRKKIWSIRKPYDYAWIKKAIDCGIVPGLPKLKFYSAQAYITYLQRNLGVENIGNKSSYKSTFNKYYKEVVDKYFPFHYTIVR